MFNWGSPSLLNPQNDSFSHTYLNFTTFHGTYFLFLIPQPNSWNYSTLHCILSECNSLAFLWDVKFPKEQESQTLN